MTQQSLSFGQRLRDTAFANMSAGKHGWLIEESRTEAERIARETGEISVDNVRPMIEERHAEYIKQNRVSGSIWGTVFHDKRFRKLRYQPSVRPSSRGRIVAVYGLNDN